MARRKKRNANNIICFIIALIIVWCFNYYQQDLKTWAYPKEQENINQTYNIDDIPVYSGANYVIINDNNPNFIESDYSNKSYEKYSELDFLGRCGVAIANIGKDLMPTEERGSIGMIKPTGWQTVKYDIVDGKYLYNRCHLIGYQLTAETEKVLNLMYLFIIYKVE